MRALSVGSLAVCLFLLAGPAPHGRFFNSEGVPIRFVEQGAGEPVVLVHAYMADAEINWIDSGVFQKLARHYRVIAFDCRGHGRSGKPHDPKQYGVQMTEDVVRLLDHLHISRAHLVGYSMGANIVAQVVALYPERVRTATLGGSVGRLHWSAADDRLSELEADEIERGSVRSMILRLSAAGSPKPSEAQIQQLSARLFAGQDRLALAAVRRSWRDQVVSAAEIARARVPILAIFGSSDPSRSELSELKRSVPNIRVAIIPGATHMTAFTRPEFVRAIEDFLRRH